MKKILFFLFVALVLSSLTAQEHLLSGYSGFWKTGEVLFLPNLFKVEDNQLPFLRNEIFARYGRAFTTESYRVFFKAQSWYREVPGYQDNWVPTIERENADLLIKLEQSAATRNAFVQAMLRNIEYQAADHLGSLIINGVDSAAYFPEGVSDYGSYRDYYIDQQMTPCIVWGDWLILYSEVVLGGTNKKQYDVTCLRLNHATHRIVDEQWAQVPATIFDGFLQRRSY